MLAGSQLLTLPAEFPSVVSTRSFVAGASFVLWAVGMWWIPLLVVFGIWRHLVRRYPLRYETKRRPEIEVWLTRHLLPDYQGSTVWTSLGAMYLLAFSQIDRLDHFKGSVSVLWISLSMISA